MHYKTESNVGNCSVCHLIHTDRLGGETSGRVVLCTRFTLDLINPKKLYVERKL
jgi:hypothetical protein